MFSAQHKFGRLGAPAGRSLEAQIAALFPDVWYDPSDFSTLYQDAAGTTPVTALEQPVGLMKDKSGNDRHAYHTSGDTTTRPTVSRRISLLSKTEQFDDAAWIKTNATVTANSTTAPDGTMTADTLSESGVTGQFFVASPFEAFASGVRYTQSVFAKAGSNSVVQLVFASGPWGVNAYANFDLATGTVGTVGSTATASIVYVGGGWYRCAITATAAAATVGAGSVIALCDNSTTAARAPSYTGDGTSGIYIWGASLVPADLAGLPYQRVNTTTDYDSDPSKFPTFLRCDGVNDSLQTNAIDFTGTDKMFVGVGVRKLSDAALGVIAELSTSAGANNGAFVAFTMNAAGYGFNSRGTIEVGSNTTTGFAAPITNIVSGIGDISGDVVRTRVDGSVVASNTADQGTGNYGNHKLYLFMRAGTSLPFNGRMFGLLIKGSTPTASQIALAERWLASKTKTVTLA